MSVSDACVSSSWLRAPLPRLLAVRGPSLNRRCSNAHCHAHCHRGPLTPQSPAQRSTHTPSPAPSLGRSPLSSSSMWVFLLRDLQSRDLLLARPPRPESSPSHCFPVLAFFSALFPSQSFLSLALAFLSRTRRAQGQCGLSHCGVARPRPVAAGPPSPWAGSETRGCVPVVCASPHGKGLGIIVAREQDPLQEGDVPVRSEPEGHAEAQRGETREEQIRCPRLFLPNGIRLVLHAMLRCPRSYCRLTP